MDLFDLFYNNVYTIDKTFDQPNNFEEVRKEIISIIKENNLSLSQSAMVFNSVIKTLGNTPINEL